MASAEDIRSYLNEHDQFCRHNGITLTHIEPGYAEAEMIVTDAMLNSRGVVQGGAIFTLADFTFAGAANAAGAGCVSLNCSISFIKPGTPPKLRAVARELHRGRCTGVYQVEVFDAKNKLVAAATVNGFAVGTFPPADGE